MPEEEEAQQRGGDSALTNKELQTTFLSAAASRARDAFTVIA